MLTWIVRDQIADDPALLPEIRHPVTRALLFMRGIRTDEEAESFFYPRYERDMHDPFLFTGMERIVERVRQAMDTKARVGVFGDYDADGVTSSAILRSALEGLGLDVSIYIPDKNTEGHGLHINAVDAFEQEGVKLFFTVDCGMTNYAEVAEARQRGMDVIIIDHHHVPAILPEALAIVNPKLPDETYPFKELCGAGTTFKTAQALYRKLRPEDEIQLKWLLDLTALGTVADCMPLIGENRTIVHFGLLVLNKTRRVGLEELLAVGKIRRDEHTALTSWSISFQIAPRINAAGRMAHARAAHDLLMETDRVKARELALEIEGRNQERQKMSTFVTGQVRTLAEAAGDHKFIFAVDEHFPFGIVGLVAGRIAHEFNKPTCVLQRGPEESQGSLRSIPSINIIEAIGECAELLMKFGGHAQAAGLTIKNENLEAFHEKLNGIIEKKLEGIAVKPELWIDMEVTPYQVTMELSQELKRFAPFGEGNREPVFLMKNLSVIEARLVGNGSKHLKLVLQGGSPRTISDTDLTFTPGGYAQEMVRGKKFDAIAFGQGEKFPDLSAGEMMDVAFTLDENTWNGSTKLQLKVVDLRRVE